MLKVYKKTRNCIHDYLHKVTGAVVYNADAVGAYNIMRKYFAGCGKEKKISVTGLSSPLIIKVAV